MRTTTILRNAVDGLLLAHLVKSAITSFTHAIMSAVPRSPNAVTDLPFLLRGRHGDDITDYLVAWNAGT